VTGTKDQKAQQRNTEAARSIITGTNRAMRFGRRTLRRIPSQPRCKLCASPFGGFGGRLMRLMDKGPWPKNPKYCSMCFKDMAKHRAGAEVECSYLFADVRGSTHMAEGMAPTEFHATMDRFYEVATDVLVEWDGIVDKFVGDEVVAIFIPALNGELHAERAIAAGCALLAATQNGTEGAWIPIGIGVNTGVAYVGAVGVGENVEFSALGDPVNVAARLASAAGEGELLVTIAAAQSAHLADGNLEHRSLELKGKSEATEVVVLGPAVV
jgi:adenylate cyclase